MNKDQDAPTQLGTHGPASQRPANPDAPTEIVLRPGLAGGQAAPQEAFNKDAGNETEIVLPAQGGESLAQPSGGYWRRGGPVTGWLVIVKGPGRGVALELGVGNNHIGRSRDHNRVVLDFGDATISSANSGNVAYDIKAKQFVLVPGQSTNLIYLNDNAVYVPAPLKTGDLIQIGQTILYFVALCGENFSWD